MFWGYTPALNLLDEYKNNVSESLPNELNILLIGSGDCRHILMTCARKYRHEKIKINFFVVEACMENIAKQLLLLNIALQPDKNLGLDQKTKIFMELYGNTLVRPSVAKYLSATAYEMIKMITDYDYLRKITSNVTFEIKYKDRDYLENLLKFWCGKDDFNICDIWDRRLRKLLGVRYDSKTGAFDWDLHIRLHNANATQICNQEYQRFRQNGVAFTWLESEVSKPNRSMVCGVVPNGESFVHYGYLGDMETGPFVTFGLECDDKKYLESTHGQNSYRATDVTERNLKQIFYELSNQNEYVHESASDYQLGSTIIKQEKFVVDVKAVEVIAKPAEKWIEMEDVSIQFLTTNMLDAVKRKDFFKHRFDVVYFASTYLKHFNQELINNVTKAPSVLLIENQRFFVSSRKENLEEFEKNVIDRVRDIEFLKKHNFDIHNCNYCIFSINKV